MKYLSLEFIHLKSSKSIQVNYLLIGQIINRAEKNSKKKPGDLILRLFPATKY
jgi:hypothetical protein